MKRFVFLAKANTIITLKGNIKRILANDPVELYDQDGEDVKARRIPGSDHLVLVVEEDLQPAEPVADQAAPVPQPEVQPSSDASPSVPEIGVESTPVVAEPAPVEAPTQPSIVVDHLPESEEEMKALSPDVIEKLSHLPEVPLPEGTHWSTVKAFLMGLEAEGDFDPKLVEAVALKFSSYKAVREEAERILSKFGQSLEAVESPAT